MSDLSSDTNSFSAQGPPPHSRDATCCVHIPKCVYSTIYVDYYCLYGGGRNTLRPYYVHKSVVDKLDTLLPLKLFDRTGDATKRQ